MTTYYDYFRDKNKEGNQLNQSRYEEYRKQLEAEENKRRAENAGLLDNGDSKPYALKNLATEQTPTAKITEQRKEEAPAPKPQPPGSDPFTSGLAGVGAHSILAGGGGATSTAPATFAGSPFNPLAVSSQGGGTAAGAGTLPMLGGAVALGAYANNLYEGGGKDIVQGKGHSNDYVNTFVNMNPVTATPNRLAKEVFGVDAGSFFSSGKDGRQVARDNVRENLVNADFLDDNYQLTLADGTKFDVGKDGGARLKNPDGSERRYMDVDFNNPLASEVVSYVDPLAEIFSGGDKDLRSNFAGYLTNAALSNATDIKGARANIDAFYASSGITKEYANQRIQELQDAGSIDQQRADVYRASISKLNLPSESTGGGQMPSFGGGGFSFSMPAQPKPLPPPPPSNTIDYSLLNMAQQNKEPQARGDVIFSNALKSILGG